MGLLEKARKLFYGPLEVNVTFENQSGVALFLRQQPDGEEPSTFSLRCTTMTFLVRSDLSMMVSLVDEPFPEPPRKYLFVPKDWLVEGVPLCITKGHLSTKVQFQNEAAFPISLTYHQLENMGEIAELAPGEIKLIQSVFLYRPIQLLAVRNEEGNTKKYYKVYHQDSHTLFDDLIATQTATDETVDTLVIPAEAGVMFRNQRPDPVCISFPGSGQLDLQGNGEVVVAVSNLNQRFQVLDKATGQQLYLGEQEFTLPQSQVGEATDGVFTIPIDAGLIVDRGTVTTTEELLSTKAKIMNYAVFPICLRYNGLENRDPIVELASGKTTEEEVEVLLHRPIQVWAVHQAGNSKELYRVYLTKSDTGEPFALVATKKEEQEPLVIPVDAGVMFYNRRRNPILISCPPYKEVLMEGQSQGPWRAPYLDHRVQVLDEGTGQPLQLDRMAFILPQAQVEEAKDGYFSIPKEQLVVTTSAGPLALPTVNTAGVSQSPSNDVTSQEENSAMSTTSEGKDSNSLRRTTESSHNSSEGKASSEVEGASSENSSSEPVGGAANSTLLGRLSQGKRSLPSSSGEAQSGPKRRRICLSAPQLQMAPKSAAPDVEMDEADSRSAEMDTTSKVAMTGSSQSSFSNHGLFGGVCTSDTLKNKSGSDVPRATAMLRENNSNSSSGRSPLHPFDATAWSKAKGHASIAPNGFAEPKGFTKGLPVAPSVFAPSSKPNEQVKHPGFASIRMAASTPGLQKPDAPIKHPGFASTVKAAPTRSLQMVPDSAAASSSSSSSSRLDAGIKPAAAVITNTTNGGVLTREAEDDGVKSKERHGGGVSQSDECHSFSPGTLMLGSSKEGSADSIGKDTTMEEPHTTGDVSTESDEEAASRSNEHIHKEEAGCSEGAPINTREGLGLDEEIASSTNKDVHIEETSTNKDATGLVLASSVSDLGSKPDEPIKHPGLASTVKAAPTRSLQMVPDSAAASSSSSSSSRLDAGIKPAATSITNATNGGVLADEAEDDGLKSKEGQGGGFGQSDECHSFSPETLMLGSSKEGSADSIDKDTTMEEADANGDASMDSNEEASSLSKKDIHKEEAGSSEGTAINTRHDLYWDEERASSVNKDVHIEEAGTMADFSLHHGEGLDIDDEIVKSDRQEEDNATTSPSALPSDTTDTALSRKGPYATSEESKVEECPTIPTDDERFPNGGSSFMKDSKLGMPSRRKRALSSDGEHQEPDCKARKHRHQESVDGASMPGNDDSVEDNLLPPSSTNSAEDALVEEADAIEDAPTDIVEALDLDEEIAKLDGQDKDNAMDGPTTLRPDTRPSHSWYTGLYGLWKARKVTVTLEQVQSLDFSLFSWARGRRGLDYCKEVSEEFQCWSQRCKGKRRFKAAFTMLQLRKRTAGKAHKMRCQLCVVMMIELIDENDVKDEDQERERVRRQKWEHHMKHHSEDAMLKQVARHWNPKAALEEDLNRSRKLAERQQEVSRGPSKWVSQNHGGSWRKKDPEYALLAVGSIVRLEILLCKNGKERKEPWLAEYIKVAFNGQEFVHKIHTKRVKKSFVREVFTPEFIALMRKCNEGGYLEHHVTYDTSEPKPLPRPGNRWMNVESPACYNKFVDEEALFQYIRPATTEKRYDLKTRERVIMTVDTLSRIARQVFSEDQEAKVDQQFAAQDCRWIKIRGGALPLTGEEDTGEEHVDYFAPDLKTLMTDFHGHSYDCLSNSICSTLAFHFSKEKVWEAKEKIDAVLKNLDAADGDLTVEWKVLQKVEETLSVTFQRIKPRQGLKLQLIDLADHQNCPMIARCADALHYFGLTPPPSGISSNQPPGDLQPSEDLLPGVMMTEPTMARPLKASKKNCRTLVPHTAGRQEFGGFLYAFVMEIGAARSSVASNESAVSQSQHALLNATVTNGQEDQQLPASMATPSFGENNDSVSVHVPGVPSHDDLRVAGWAKHWDANRKAYYYYPIDGSQQTTWVNPLGANDASTLGGHKGKPAARTGNESASVHIPGIPSDNDLHDAGWAKRWDANHKAHYYYSIDGSQQTTWVNPLGANDASTLGGHKGKSAARTGDESSSEEESSSGECETDSSDEVDRKEEMVATAHEVRVSQGAGLSGVDFSNSDEEEASLPTKPGVFGLDEYGSSDSD